MQQPLLWLLPLISHHPWMIVAVVLDMEAPMTSSWLEGDWSTENQVPETVTEDLASGCICRTKLHQHVVCYGGASCSAFPRHVALADGIVDLRVKTSGFQVLQRGDLDCLAGLEYLEVDANFHLKFIEPGIFANMSKLVNLSISFNSELKHLNEYVFFGLDNLLRLRLMKNGFTNILDVSAALSPKYLPGLTSLALSENVFKTIHIDSFLPMNGTQVDELDLILCQIEQIQPESLLVFRRLNKLRLGENLVTEDMLENMFSEMAAHENPVTFVNLYELGFRNGKALTPMLEAIARLKVRHLILSRNHLENLYDGLFPRMPHIEVLDLREVSAVEIEANTLSEAVMPRLRTLLLSRNKLPGVTPGVLLPQLSELDLSMNSGSEQRLASYFDASSSDMFRNMTKLTSLNLSFNRINTISNQTFTSVPHLSVLGLKNATIYYIAEGSFAMLNQLYLLNLENNPFRPFNKFDTMIFKGLYRLEILFLSSCKIKSFSRPDIFKPLIRLKYLSLKDNSLIHINSDLLPPLRSLVGVDLSSNMLGPWANGNRILSNHSNLQVLLLSNNRLTHLTQTMMDDFYQLARVDLTQNPFVCNCLSFNRTTTWLLDRNLTTNASVFNPLHVCLSPDSWRDKPIVDFIEAIGYACAAPSAAGQQGNAQWYVTMCVAALFLVLAAVLCYIYRWYIRYWIFLAKMAYIRHHFWFARPSKASPGEFKYDAFVSYSNEDRNFIVGLVAMLENHEPFLKLCVYERDFELGSIISETVLNKVESSRRTLLIISDAFARSQWCMWELHIAEYHNLFFKTIHKNQDRNQDDSLIMIKLGPVADTHVTPTLKYLMKTRIYLEWNTDAKKQKPFWEKLRSALSKP